MTIRNSKLVAGLVLAMFLPVPRARAQESSIDDLRKEIRGLSQTMKDMQKDLEEIKTLLRGRTPQAPPQNVVLDLGKNPTEGEPTAKLTLVEFSDYQ